MQYTHQNHLNIADMEVGATERVANVGITISIVSIVKKAIASKLN